MEVRQVYLMFNPESGLHKIGISHTPNKRLNQIRKSYPKTILIGFFEGTFKVELSMHQNFCLKRVFGEWFNLTDEDVDLIKRSSGDDFLNAL